MSQKLLFFQSLKARLHDKGPSHIIILQDGISSNVLLPKETSSQVRLQVQISANDIFVCSLNKIEPPKGKPTICLRENKDADQLRGNLEADQRLCFCYTDSTFPFLLNSKISSF